MAYQYRYALIVFFITLYGVNATTAIAQQGLQLGGVGPVNRSMGGAATAAPIDPIGALHWNAATIGALPSSQVGFGVELLSPAGELSSSLGGYSGTDTSDSAWTPIPSIGLVTKAPGDWLTFGLGIYATAGYILNYPASGTNPILFPQTPTTSTPFPGFGRIFGEVQLMQLAPAISMKLTEDLYVGGGPLITIGKVAVNPAALTSPDDANLDGFYSYPSGTGTRYQWGGGFQLGVYYEGLPGFNLGASLKSQQWMEDFTYNSSNELGLPRDFTIDLDYPLIVSLGAAFVGLQDHIFAVDVRYMDWKNVNGFGSPAGFDSTGRVTGFGWDSIWTVGVGMQRQLTDLASVRLGYAYNQSPISDSVAGFNVGAPMILQHAFNAGLSLQITGSMVMQAGYYYAPEAEASGSIQGPTGPVPNSNVNYRISAHAISVGATVSF